MAVAGLITIFVGLTALVCSLPDVGDLTRNHPTETAYMRMRASESPVGYKRMPRRWTTLESMSPLAVCAVVKAEDADFFSHEGIDWNRARSALRNALSGKRFTGASTITQQVARNLYLGPERTATRKLREALIALKLERHLSKKQILELYLNVVEWGDGVWGVSGASEHYLQEPSSSLDAFDGAFLASLLAAPRRPLDGANLVRSHQVQGRVLIQLYRSGIIDERALRRGMGSRRTFRNARMRGLPLAPSLSQARAAPPLWVRPPELRVVSPLPASQALETACGRAQELRNSAAEPAGTNVSATGSARSPGERE